MRSAENRKRKLPDSDVVAEFDDTYPYSVYVNLKQAATGKWHEHLRLVEVVQMKGNFWSRCGFSQQSVNYLYPEEALMLVERGQLQMQGSDGQPMPSSVFYEIVIAEISLPVYLTYIKLRVRNNQSTDNRIKCIIIYTDVTVAGVNYTEI